MALLIWLRSLAITLSCNKIGTQLQNPIKNLPSKIPRDHEKIKLKKQFVTFLLVKPMFFMHLLIEATLTAFPLAYRSHPWISSSYTSGYSSIILLINNTSCAVNGKRRPLSSTTCSFIYADLCDSFFTYRPFVLLFPSAPGNQPWKYFCIFSKLSLQMSTPRSMLLLWRSLSTLARANTLLANVNFENTKQPCSPNRLHSCRHFWKQGRHYYNTI